MEMTGPNCMDENDSENFFDQIDDLIEFPPDNDDYADKNLVDTVDYKDFPSVWNDPLPDSDSLLFNSNSNAISDLSAEISVPYEDIVQLEWLSTFMEDSFNSAGLTLGKENVTVDKGSYQQFQTSSPVSVLETSSSASSTSSCSVGKTMPPVDPSNRGPHRARSKRPRPPTFNPRSGMQLIYPSSSSFIETPFENFAESHPMEKLKKPFGVEQKKKKKAKPLVPVDPTEKNQGPNPTAVLKCMHCAITKTPQWRAGPMGPKSLCNACGVRYKSGRLFPEYRPAASPTFVPSVHSNSHKKVIEMRTKGGAQMTATSPTVVNSRSGCVSDGSMSYE